MAAVEPSNNAIEQGGHAAWQADVRQERPSIEIDEALREGWFEFWYQPKVNLTRKYLAGAEAIARLRHPTYGVMPPGSFEPRLSEGSLERLTEYSLVAALQSWSVFEEVGFNLALAINVPTSVLETLPIADLVAQFRPRSDHWPGIILEVSEDQVVRDATLAQVIANHLRIGGVKIAIDNFGAGHSSLSTLRALPFAELKISRSLIHNCATDATNAAICQTIIDLAHRFGSAAVAEGIESQMDLQAVIAMGCDFGQGALISPPMPQEHFLELLLRRSNGPESSARGEEQQEEPVAQDPQRIAGSANGSGVPSGTGIRNTSRVIATMA
jgi:EAL domain-containing protein (putative c-di-GMP-specific phosphodiesterase class I)